MSKRKHFDAESQDQTHGGLGLGLNWASNSHAGDSTSHIIQGSNIGFQLLKKYGWKEGTGLGVAEQGRLEPIEAHVKTDKRGIGAEKKANKTTNSTPKDKVQELPKATTKKTKTLNRRLRKLEAEEKQLQEKAFDIEFFREFWPDNI